MVSAKGKEKVTDSGVKGKRKWGGGDDDKTGGKRKNRGASQYLDDVAYAVDNEEEESSDDSLFYDSEDFEDESGSVFKVNNEPGKASHSELPTVKTEDVSEEEFERMMEERYKPGSSFVTYAEDCRDRKNSIYRGIDIPSTENPTTQKAKCMDRMSNPSAQTTKDKTWPHYEYSYEIFGKSGATRENADIEDFNSINKDQLNANVNDAGSKGNTNSAPVEENNDFISVCPQHRPKDSIGEKLVEVIRAFCEQINSSLSELTKKLGVEHDMQTQRKSVYEVLGGIGQLSIAQRVRVAKVLVNNNNELDLFFSLPDEAKVEMVRQFMYTSFI